MWEALLERGVSGAPQLIEWLAIGVGVAIATFMGRINMQRGKQVAKGQDYQIAGAVIDKDAAATEEIRVLTRELIRTQQK